MTTAGDTFGPDAAASHSDGPGEQGGAGFRLGLSTQVIIGLVPGIAAGLFFGEPITVVQPLGSNFIGLLQMTVIPYIVVSLIAAIGRLEMARIRMLAVKGGGLILPFWVLILVVVALIPIGYPGWESASFYSTSL